MRGKKDGGRECNSGEYDSELQAGIWCKERRLEEAKSEALDAASNFAKIGATEDVERCRELLQKIEQEANLKVRLPLVSSQKPYRFLHLLIFHSQFQVRNDEVGAIPHIHSTCTPTSHRPYQPASGDLFEIILPTVTATP